MIKSAEAALARIDEFDFVGSGGDIARFLMSPFYDGNLRVTEIYPIAAYCFRLAKARAVVGVEEILISARCLMAIRTQAMHILHVSSCMCQT